MNDPRTFRFGHGPDADDAWLFEPLLAGRVPTGGLNFRHRHLPFDVLNRAAAGPDPFEITMLSAAAYAALADAYEALPFGGSFVRTMGPRLVAREARPLASLTRARIAIPGARTTGGLLLRLALPEAETFVAPFEEIAARVAAGDGDAGVVIHEQQLDFARHGLSLVADLGAEWMRRHGLPTPLAVLAIRRDLPIGLRDRIRAVLEASMAEARAHPEAPLKYALGFAGGLGRAATRAMVEEYVSDDTFRTGDRAERAIRLLTAQARALYARERRGAVAS